MCLAIPGQVIDLDASSRVALVNVLGVRRRINVELVWDEGLHPGDWILIHVGFALSKVSEAEAAAQLRLLEALGEDVQAMEEVQGYTFDASA